MNNEKDEKDNKEDDKYNDLKIRMEENIKMLKDQIFQLLELSFKNKSDLQKLNKIEESFDSLKNDLSKLTQEIEDYKKITNERIEKIFKLVMMNGLTNKV
jgi:molecular chaperone GrpE (heat shock protein)